MRGPAKTALLAVLFSALIGPGCFDDLLELVTADQWGDNHTFAEAADISTRSGEDLDGLIVTSAPDYFVITTAGTGDLTVTCTANVDINELSVTIYDNAAPPQPVTPVSDTTLLLTRTVVFNDGGSGAAAGTYHMCVQYTGAPPVEE